jgi:predicted metal-binding protein
MKAWMVSKTTGKKIYQVNVCRNCKKILADDNIVDHCDGECYDAKK